MKVVVTGSREFRSQQRVYDALCAVSAACRIHRLAHGSASGVDEFAKRWARRYNVDCIGYDAEWNKYGRSAGPRRNGHMLRVEDPDVVIAFTGGSGTQNCVEQAVGMGIPVVRTTGRTAEQVAAEVAEVARK